MSKCCRWKPCRGKSIKRSKVCVAHLLCALSFHQKGSTRLKMCQICFWLGLSPFPCSPPHLMPPASHWLSLPLPLPPSSPWIGIYLSATAASAFHSTCETVSNNNNKTVKVPIPKITSNFTLELFCTDYNGWLFWLVTNLYMYTFEHFFAAAFTGELWWKFMCENWCLADNLALRYSTLQVLNV